MKKTKWLWGIMVSISLAFLLVFWSLSVQAESTVNVQVDSYFDESNVITTNVSNQKIGSSVVFQSQLSSREGYVFAYWIYNGIIQEGLPQNASFTITSNTHLIAVFRPSDQFACLFMDANGHLIDVQYVFSGMNASDIPSESLPSKPGYVVSSAKWDRSLTNITGNTVFMLQYVPSNSATYTLSVTNGTGGGTYAYDAIATVVGDAPPSGKQFQYWKSGDRVVSREPTYSFSVHSNVSLEAVYSDETFRDIPMVTVGDNLNVRSGYQTYVGQFHIPSGYQYVEHGLLVSGTEGVIDLSSSSITRYQGSKYNPLTHEFVMSVPTNVTNWLSHRAYLIVVNFDGDLMTVYDEILTESSQIPTDLFFSYYIEGSSNNKALGIFNGTGQSVDMTAYTLSIYYNGASTTTTNLSLTGSLAVNSVYVLANTAANATILSVADFTHANINFNGDDAIVLKKGSTIVDVIGQVGFDPGTEWGSGLVSTADNSLSRKSTVFAGRTDTTGVFDPSVEWEGYATDTTTGLDSHTYSGGSAKTISVIEAHWPTSIYQIDDPIQLTNGYVRIFYSEDPPRPLP
jgi:hypothetical protein